MTSKQMLGQFMKSNWNPSLVLVPHKLDSDEHKLNLEYAAKFIYDVFCQFQNNKSKLDLSTRTEQFIKTTQGKLLPERTGTDG